MQENARLVSILIPAHNAGRWVGSTIESALNQTWKNVEVIVVDDGSTDDTFSIARSFERDNVKVISQKNAGAPAARNRALAESTGSVIQYLDADDLLAPDKIERQLPLLENGVLCSGRWGSFYTNPHKAKFLPSALGTNLTPVEWLVTSWSGGGMMQPGAWLLERELATSVGPWNESLSYDDDGEYFTRVILGSRQVVFCPDAVVYYRIGNRTSLSWTNSSRGMKSQYLAAMLSTQRLIEEENSERTRRAAASKLVDFIYDSYPNEASLGELAEKKIRDLGFPQMPGPRGGYIFELMTRLIGWKRAKRLRWPYYLAKVNIQRLLG